jgi:hypothetical protein
MLTNEYAVLVCSILALDIMSKTGQKSSSSSSILGTDSPIGGTMLGYGLLGTIVVIAVIVLIVRAL